MRALFSLTNKDRSAELAQCLAKFGCEAVSTGGTAKHLIAAGVTVIPVEEVTGFPEIMDGRVKTLHPLIHGGILARRDNKGDREEAAKHAITMLDFVVVNLYAFEQAIAEGASFEEALDKIDIGGVALIRAAAKSHKDVVVLTDPDQYDSIIAELEENGEISQSTRLRLAAEALFCTAWYDTAIAIWMMSQCDDQPKFPERILMPFERLQVLRYAENPHQRGALYRQPGFAEPSVVTAKQLWGNVPSATTIGDLNAGLEILREFYGCNELAAVVIKHNGPCGVSFGATPKETFTRARDADPVSAFGGVIACNFVIDMETAATIVEMKVDGIIATGFADGALELIQAKRKKGQTPIFTVSELTPLPQGTLNFRHVVGGMVLQEADLDQLLWEDWKTVTTVEVAESAWSDIVFGCLVIKHVKSNSVIVVKDGQTVGIGNGQTSRVDSTRIALEQAKAAGRAEGAVLISDSFFPFDDSVKLAAEYGISTVVQQGGSIRDNESIAAADEHGIAMVMTSRRMFWH